MFFLKSEKNIKYVFSNTDSQYGHKRVSIAAVNNAKEIQALMSAIPNSKFPSKRKSVHKLICSIAASSIFSLRTAADTTIRVRQQISA